MPLFHRFEIPCRPATRAEGIRMSGAQEGERGREEMKGGMGVLLVREAEREVLQPANPASHHAPSNQLSQHVPLLSCLSPVCQPGMPFLPPSRPCQNEYACVPGTNGRCFAVGKHPYARLAWEVSTVQHKYNTKPRYTDVLSVHCLSS